MARRKITKTSYKGRLEIAEHEGVVLGPYLDSKGIRTYGIGHTKAAGGLNPEKMDAVDTRGWSDQRVKEELRAILEVFETDLEKYEARVNDAVNVPLHQHEYDALVSFDFNTGGIYRANLTKALNEGRYNLAGELFMGWLKPIEIKKRREAEMHLFLTGQYDANGNAIALYDARPNGKAKFRESIDALEIVGRPPFNIMQFLRSLICPSS